jgi:hypothetical protein
VAVAAAMVTGSESVGIVMLLIVQRPAIE